MNSRLLKNSIQTGGSLLVSFYFYLVIIITPSLSFSENKQDIVNQLYQEIMNASADNVDAAHTSKKSIPALSSGSDSSGSPSVSKENLSGSSSEQLKKEIEKIQTDINLRHSATVKFMQDDK
jgi:hypothetical protein